jgi:hypothetical protein
VRSFWPVAESLQIAADKHRCGGPGLDRGELRLTSDGQGSSGVSPVEGGRVPG